MGNQITKMVTVIEAAAPAPNQIMERVSFFNEDGTPYELEGVDGSEVELTGYEIAEAADDVEATDTVNEAVGKLEYRLAALETSETGEVDTEAEVRATVLTGLSTASATAVTAADSILVAIGKLQAQLDAL